MEKLTKKDLLKAIDQVISGYETKESYGNHTFSDCGLCQFYKAHNCKKICINTAFTCGSSSMGCVNRVNYYKNLNWDYVENYPRLAEYWKEIKKYLAKRNAVDILTPTDAIKAKIVEIAKKYNNLDEI